MTKATYLPNSNIEVIDVDTDEEQEVPLTAAEEAIDDLSQAMQDDNSTYINIYKENSGFKDKVFVAKVPADKYTYSELLDFVQTRYGGGDYRFMLFGRTSKGGNGILQNKLVSIAQALTPEINQENGALNSVIAHMEKMSQQIIQLSQQQNGGGQSRADMLQEMLLYKQLFDNPQPQGNGLQDFITNLAAFKELGILGGESGGNNDLGLGDMAGMVSKLIDKAGTPQQIPPPQTNPINPPKVRERKPTVTPEQKAAIKAEQLRVEKLRENTPENEGDKMLKELMNNQALKLGLTMLVNAAVNKSDPGDYTKMIFENIPESTIKEHLTKPESLELLMKVNSAVQDHKEWFLDLFEHLKACMGMESKFDDLYDDHDDDQDSDSLTIDNDSAKIVVDNPEKGATVENELPVNGDT